MVISLTLTHPYPGSRLMKASGTEILLVELLLLSHSPDVSRSYSSSCALIYACKGNETVLGSVVASCT